MISSIGIIFSSVCALLAVYCISCTWLRRKLNYWRGLGVRQWEADDLFGNYKDLLTKRCTEPDVVDKAYKLFSGEKYVGLYFFWKPQFLVRDPELMKNILLNDFGHFCERVQISTYEGTDRIVDSLFFAKNEQWKIYRGAFTQMFTPSKFKAMVGLFEQEFSKELIPILDSIASEATHAEGQDVDIAKIVLGVIASVVAKVFLGLDIGGPQSIFTETAQKFTFPTVATSIKYTILRTMPSVYRFLRLRTVEKEVGEYFSDLAGKIMEIKGKQGELGSDLISFLQKCKRGEIKNLTDVSDNFIAAHIFIFFIAGTITTPFALSYALFELSRNVEVQEKLRKELETLDRGKKQDITYELLNKMTYAGLIWQEVNRMYPCFGVLSRVSIKDYKIDENLTLPSGTTVLIPGRALHYDPQYFPDPHTFNPERFSSEVPWVWMPFGKGPRQCIGMRFAELGMKTALAMLVRHYDFTPSPKMKFPIAFNPNSVLSTNKSLDGVWIRIKKRKEN